MFSIIPVTRVTYLIYNIAVLYVTEWVYVRNKLQQNVNVDRGGQSSQLETASVSSWELRLLTH